MSILGTKLTFIIRILSIINLIGQFNKFVFILRKNILNIIIFDHDDIRQFIVHFRCQKSFGIGKNFFSFLYLNHNLNIFMLCFIFLRCQFGCLNIKGFIPRPDYDFFRLRHRLCFLLCTPAQCCQKHCNQDY